MDHRADIGFVNAHTKRDRRDHYLDLARKELLLDPLAVLGIEPGVIRRSGKVTGQLGGQGRGLLASGCVDDSRPALRIEQQFAGERSSLRRRGLDNLNRDVSPPKAV